MCQIPAGLQVNNVKFLPVVNPFIRAIGIPQQFEPQVKLNPEISHQELGYISSIQLICPIIS